MPELELNEVERLADAALGRNAQITQQTIERLRGEHQAQVAAFLAAIGKVRGVEVPATAQRQERDGQIYLTWPDPKIPDKAEAKAAKRPRGRPRKVRPTAKDVAEDVVQSILDRVDAESE